MLKIVKCSGKVRTVNQTSFTINALNDQCQMGHIFWLVHGGEYLSPDLHTDVNKQSCVA
jgi:hypothetical protein